MKFFDFLKRIPKMIEDNLCLRDKVEDLNVRVYALEQRNRLISGECRRLTVENQRLRTELNKVVSFHVVHR